MSTRPRIICARCGTPHDRDTRCPTCPPPATPARKPRTREQEQRRGSARARGYTSAWDRLSRLARQRQPFCSDCGSPDNLTVDHSPQAWQRQAAGKSIRLTDVDVVCMDCNNRRGPARGPAAVERPTIAAHRDALQTQGREGSDGRAGPLGRKAESQTHTPRRSDL